MFPDSEEAVLSLPADCGAESFSVVYADGEGNGSQDAYRLEAAAGRSVALDVPKNTPVAVLAYPVAQGRLLRPYGAIYPCTTALAEKDGFAASILYRLYCGASGEDGETVRDYASRFNWQRFMDECSAAPDPWALDDDRILQRISSGSFKKTDIKLKN